MDTKQEETSTVESAEVAWDTPFRPIWASRFTDDRGCTLSTSGGQSARAGDDNQVGTMKSGYLYVLVHPSDPELYKIGVTILHPEERLAQHNRHYEEHAGQIVKETGQKWELKTYIAVSDPYWAERAFWGATPFADIPYRGGIEVQKMEWRLVQQGLEAAEKVGLRPSPPRATPVRNREWMLKQLEGSGITMIGRYLGLLRGMEFQCEKGHVFKESPGVLVNRKSCPCCVDWNWLSGFRKGLRASLR